MLAARRCTQKEVKRAKEPAREESMGNDNNFGTVHSGSVGDDAAEGRRLLWQTKSPFSCRGCL